MNRERKYSMTGQMSLFDMVSDDQKAEFDIPLPNVGEYEKETKLAFEKEVLGIYLSGHPLEEYEDKWKKNITRTTLEFQLDEETGRGEGPMTAPKKNTRSSVRQDHQIHQE